MLEELLNEGHLRAGQKILCMVPESGRFVVSFMLLTVTEALQPSVASHGGSARDADADAAEAADAILPDAARRAEDVGPQAALMRQLAQVWAEFEGRLNRVPVVDKINRGKLRLEDYRLLLLNLRQQVAEGARWISRAASNVSHEAFGLRSMFIGHAADEHRDFQLIEHDFVSIGGSLEEITRAEKNIGSEALSAWMFQRASQENPFDLLGAMFIIEGLGKRSARRWALKIREQLGLDAGQVSFLLYHGANDENHFEKLESALASGILTDELCRRIVKTARVTARLYALQLEELGNV
jgi:3-oxoacyl-[acyl-carrier-protein] synthase-3